MSDETKVQHVAIAPGQAHEILKRQLRIAEMEREVLILRRELSAVMSGILSGYVAGHFNLVSTDLSASPPTLVIQEVDDAGGGA